MVIALPVRLVYATTLFQLPLAWLRQCVSNSHLRMITGVNALNGLLPVAGSGQMSWKS